MRTPFPYARGFAPQGEFLWIIFCMGICAAIVVPLAQQWGGWFPVAGVICVLAAGLAGMAAFQRTARWHYPPSQDTQRLVAKAADELQLKEQRLEDAFGLPACRSVEFEPGSGEVRWMLGDGRRMSAKALPLGALRSSTNRWHWAWAMQLDEACGARFATAEIAARVRALVEPLGRELGIVAMRVPEFDSREGEGVNGTFVARSAKAGLARAVVALCVMKAGAAGFQIVAARTVDGADCEVILMFEEPRVD